MAFTLNTNLYEENLVYVPLGSGNQFKQQFSESKDYKSKISFVEDTHEIFVNGKSWGFNYDKELKDLSNRLDEHDVHMATEDEHMATIDSKIELQNQHLANYNTLLSNYNALLEAKISNLTTELSTYKSKVSTLESTVTSFNNTVNQLNNRLAAVERKVKV